jgi:hypothetical protein
MALLEPHASAETFMSIRFGWQFESPRSFTVPELVQATAPVDLYIHAPIRPDGAGAILPFSSYSFVPFHRLHFSLIAT